MRCLTLDSNFLISYSFVPSILLKSLISDVINLLISGLVHVQVSASYVNGHVIPFQ
jgi:hypothetical protein